MKYDLIIVSLVFCITGILAFASDNDSDGMLDFYEEFYGLNTSSNDAALNCDEDSLQNIDESYINTDPFADDTDRDGFFDGADSNALSRAYVPFGAPYWTDSDDCFYGWPDWMLSAYKMDGAWNTNPPSWHVAGSASNGIGILTFQINRSLITNNLILALELNDTSNSSLYLDLVDTNGLVAASNIFGNILSGTGQDVSLTVDVPLATYATASQISLRRGTGEITVYSALLYTDRDGDDLDEEQEVQLKTCDNYSDTDADGLSDAYEVFVSKTSPISSDSDGDGAYDCWEVLNGTDPKSAASTARLIAAKLDGGMDHSVYLLPDGRVASCGRNSDGRLGLNIQTPMEKTLRLVVDTTGSGMLNNVAGVAVGVAHTLALQNDGTLLAWGRAKHYGATEQGNDFKLKKTTPVKDNSGGKNGKGWMWGSSKYYGATGQGKNSRLKKPTLVKDSSGKGYLENIASIGTGPYTSFAIGQDGKVWAWGRNDMSQLGNGDTAHRFLPVRISGIDGSGYLESVIKVSGGGRHSAALASDGRILTWGDNSKGQLGDGSTINRSVPDYVHDSDGSGYLSNIVDVAACECFTVALASDGTVWSWGQNEAGQLGDGTTFGNQYAPIHVVGTNGTGHLSSIIAIAARESHTLALASDGILYSWGKNDCGELGDPDYTSGSGIPIHVKTASGSTPFVLTNGEIASGWKHSLIITGTHTVYAWGNNDKGSIGDNTTIDRFLPVIVDGDSDGLPDTWEYTMFFDLDETASGDPDNDSYTNLQEYQSESDPSDSGSIPPPPTYTLTVTNTIGTAIPATGTHTYSSNTFITCTITDSLIINGATQYICTGWSGSGSVPATGSTTNTGAFNITADSTITWNWMTNLSVVLPPDPATVATPLQNGAVMLLSDSTRFLYTGENPIQTGVDTNEMDEIRISVIRGRIQDITGSDLSGVTVSINNHQEFGQTLSRTDGMYDMAVNGGSHLNVSLFKDGYLGVQRKVDVPWQGYISIPDVTLIQLDTNFTVISIGTNASVQVACGSVVTDSDGVRQPTIIFPAGTLATIVTDEGTTQTVDNLTVRLTEYSVGEHGSSAMPGDMPTTVAYTHCVEMSVDGATKVSYSQPVYYYLENFIGFPVGEDVPMSTFDDSECPVWIPTPNGRVIALMGTNANGTMEVDIDGNGFANSESSLAALGFTDTERLKLASIYSSTQTLWRIPVTSFSPKDPNWPVILPSSAIAPTKITATTKITNQQSEKNNRQKTGGEIDIESRTFIENLNVAGVPYSLNYSSDRMQGKRSSDIHVQLTPDVIPSIMKRIELGIDIAGQNFHTNFVPTANLSYTFSEWDGKDAYARDVVGSFKAEVSVGYVYDASFARTQPNVDAGFGTTAGTSFLSSISARQDATLWQKLTPIVRRLLPSSGLGGWSLNVHHAYDPVSKIIHYGNGTDRGQGVGNSWGVLNRVAGTGVAGFSGDGNAAKTASLNAPYDIAFAPDGTYYIADKNNNRIRYVNANGIMTTVAGTGVAGFSGDGGAATTAQLNTPRSIAVSPCGNLIISDSGNNRIRKVDKNGIITTVAGTGSYGYSGDDGAATNARFALPTGIAITPDGTIYVVDCGNSLIRRIGPDKIIHTIAGKVSFFPFPSGDGGPAIDATLFYPSDIAIGPDGSLYITAGGPMPSIRKVTNDGIISDVTKVYFLEECKSVAVAGDGTLYMVLRDWSQTNDPIYIRKIAPDGSITTIAGSESEADDTGEGGLSATASLRDAQGITLSPDGTLYVADAGNARIVRIRSNFERFKSEDFLIPSENGGLLYHFDKSGRHLETLNSTTGTTNYYFTYTNGFLSQIINAEEEITSIERDSVDKPTAIIGPYGHRTELTLNANGWLSSLVNPANETNAMSYTPDGLLTNVSNRRGYEFISIYDESGNLVRTEDPAGGSQDLSYSEFSSGFEIYKTTSMGRTNVYTVENLAGDISKRTTTDATGLQYITISKPDGTTTETSPDGTILTTKKTPDPRFGMQAPVLGEITLQTPSGLMSRTTSKRAILLADEDDPLSLISATSTITMNSKIWTSTYTASNHTATAITPMGRQSTITTDVKGRPLRIQVPGVYGITNAYDSLGRIIEISQGMGSEKRSVFFSYGANGLLRSQSNLLGHVTSYEHDEIGRVTNVIRPDGTSVVTKYNRSESPSTVIMPDGEAHSFDQNPVYLPTTYTPPDVLAGDDATYTSHNIDRQPTGKLLPNGNTITNIFDSAGRLTKTRAESPNGDSDFIDIAYDSVGRIYESTRDGDWNVNTITYGFDGSLNTDVVWSGTVSGSVGYEFDNDFSVTAISVNNNTIAEYAYNPDGAIIIAGDLTYAYTPTSGFLTNSTLNQATENVGYNGFGEINAISTQIGGTNLCNFTYSHDSIGLVTNFTETIQGVAISHDYIYDSLGQLIEEKINDATYAIYQYDKNGNRTNSTVDGQNSVGIFDAQDRMTLYGNTTYAYSPTGVTTSKTTIGETTTYLHDSFGELQEIGTSDGDYTSYQYDAAGRRIARYPTYSDNTKYLYKDAINPIAELDYQGNIVSHFIYGTKPYVPEYMVKDGTTYKIITDHLGSVRMVVNANTGTIAQRIDYDAFGKILQDTNPGFQPFGFHGGLYDPETGLTRFGARDYDPTTGRWLSKDPIGISGGLNQYVFCSNNPVNFRDPFGLYYESNPNDGVFTRWRKKTYFVLFDGTGKLLVNGAAATADGVIPFGDPLDGVYENLDGSVNHEYQVSRFLGSASRDVLLAAGNAAIAGRVLATSGETVNMGARFLFNSGWAGQLISNTAPGWAGSAVNTTLTVMRIVSVGATYNEIKDLRK